MKSKKSFLIAAGFLVTVAGLVSTPPANAQSISVGGTFAGPHGVVSFQSGNGGYYGGGYGHSYGGGYGYGDSYAPAYVAEDCDDDDAYYAPRAVTYRTYRAPRYVAYDYAPRYRYGGYDRYRRYPRRYSSHTYSSYPQYSGNSYCR